MEWEFVLSAARSIGGAFSLDGSRPGGRFAAPTLTGESQIGWVTKDFRSRLSNAFFVSIYMYLLRHSCRAQNGERNRPVCSCHHAYSRYSSAKFAAGS